MKHLAENHFQLMREKETNSLLQSSANVKVKEEIYDAKYSSEGSNFLIDDTLLNTANVCLEEPLDKLPLKEEIKQEEIDIKDEPLENTPNPASNDQANSALPYECYTCGYKTAKKASLKSHLKFHSAEKPFACEVCNYRTVDKSNLNAHMKIHTGEKPFACSFCNYKAASNYVLKQHETIHTGLKLFKCEYCGKGATRRSGLNQHMKIHTGMTQRTYTCDRCDYTCKTSETLKRHHMTHDNLKPFQCSVCPYKTDRKKVLKTHTKRLHMREVVGMDPTGEVFVKNGLGVVYKVNAKHLPVDFNTYINHQKYLPEISRIVNPKLSTRYYVEKYLPVQDESHHATSLQTSQLKSDNNFTVYS